jgi:RNA polymerase sigma-70 factor, ECF subfamily
MASAIAHLARLGPAAASPPEADWRDEALVGPAQQDLRHFAPLYERYADLVYRFCYRRLGLPEPAADATSLIFTKALTALPHFHPGAAGSFRSWLFTIAYRVVIDAQRAPRREAPFGSDADPPDPAPSPEAAALAAEAGRDLRALLAMLDDDPRAVIELRLVGLNDREIGQALGRSEAAVRMIRTRALRRLQTLATSPQARTGDES